MSNIIKALIILACLAFVLAIIEALFGFFIIGVRPEGFSRACTNLLLIAIALTVCLKKEPKES